MVWMVEVELSSQLAKSTAEPQPDVELLLAQAFWTLSMPQTKVQTAAFGLSCPEDQRIFLGEVQHRTQVRKMAAGRYESKLGSQTRILNTRLNMFSY